jgi:hypothetical protein
MSSTKKAPAKKAAAKKSAVKKTPAKKSGGSKAPAGSPKVEARHHDQRNNVVYLLSAGTSWFVNVHSRDVEKQFSNEADARAEFELQCNHS